MEYNVNQIDNKYNFIVNHVAYVGEPDNNSIMFIGEKVKHLLGGLASVKETLVFIENTITVPEEFTENNCFVFSSNPQYEYAMFVSELLKGERTATRYHLHDGGYYVGENVVIGANAYIEPGCVIGHGVVIGDNAQLLANSVVKNAIIGNDFVAHEGAIIGADGFAMARDAEGKWYKIPALGKIVIGNHVDIGQNANVSRGTAGPTVIRDYVKIDALAYVGHDAFLEEYTELTAGSIVGGYVKTEKNASVSINATVRNRITLGENSLIGMGAVVTKSVLPSTVVIGNPARKYEK